MHICKKRKISFMALFFTILCLWSQNSTAEFEVGGGMKYFTVKALVNDKFNKYFHTVIQSTLAITQLSYRQGPWILEMQGGLTDWNISGEWQGTGLSKLGADVFYWSWQQRYAVAAKYFIINNLGIGFNYSNHSLRHYVGGNQFTYLQYRTASYDFLLIYSPWQTDKLGINISLGYAPWVQMEIYQQTPLWEDVYAIHEYDSSGTGTNWLGQAKMEYRDSAGWGLDLIYEFNWAHFPEPSNLASVTLTSSSLSGYFILVF